MGPSPLILSIYLLYIINREWEGGRRKGRVGGGRGGIIMNF